MRNLKAEISERFGNFESIYGWMVLIPFGGMLIYCGLYDLRKGYEFALIGSGIAIAIKGLRKALVNPIKYWNKVEELQEKRKVRDGD